MLLLNQYMEFCKRLANITSCYTDDQLCEVDPKELIKMFLDPAKDLYLNIKMIMQDISVYCVKQSVESVLESLVSRYENHFNQNRNLDEDHMNEEFAIAVNGPTLQYCSNVVEEAMDKYWGDKPWHFFTQSSMFNPDSESTVIKRLKNTGGKFPFME